jgi:hypothetical protein
MKNKHIEYAQPKGASGGVVIPGLLANLSSVARAILSVTASAGVQHILDDTTSLIRVTPITNAVYVKMGSGVSKSTTKGTATLSITGAIVPGTHATSEIVNDGTAPSNGDTVTVDTTVYTFKTALSTSPAVPYEVLIGVSGATALDNLNSAINGTAGAGSTYGTGTVAHPTVVATTNTNTVQTIVARVPGTSANSIATTEASTHLAWADATLGAGAGNSNPGVAPQTVTIGDITYSFVDVLSETYGATAIPYQVLFGVASANALDNLKLAIDKGATEGTNYSTGTVAHPYITATTNGDTSQVIEARQAGSEYNDIALSETLTNGAWGVTTLSDNAMSFDAYIVAGTTVDLMVQEDQTVVSFIGDGGTATVNVLEFNQ